MPEKMKMRRSREARGITPHLAFPPANRIEFACHKEANCLNLLCLRRAVLPENWYPTRPKALPVRRPFTGLPHYPAAIDMCLPATPGGEDDGADNTERTDGGKDEDDNDHHGSLRSLALRRWTIPAIFPAACASSCVQ